MRHLVAQHEGRLIAQVAQADAGPEDAMQTL